jgi:hypothetical protein
MTIQENWNIYCENIPSPQPFLDWSFYSMIGAALQRRVWIGDIRAKPLFPNLYTVLVADPGVGKTQATDPVMRFLSHWKRGAKENKDVFFDQHEYNNVAKKTQEEPTLIQIAPNATTYEALCRSFSRCISAFMPPNSNNGSPTIPYVHSSLCFNLDELSSLLRRHSDDVVNFLLQAYDCSSYSYESVGRGKDYIKNPCLSILAGTTPDFLKRVFGTQDALLSGGLASRIIFVYADEPRFRTSFPLPMKDHQHEAGKVVLDHIKKLTEVYGYVDFGPEALAFFDDWWKNIEPKTRVNNHPKLKDYYARKNINVIKLATALWFGENTTTKVVDGVKWLQRAIDIFDATERDMHKVLQFEARNPVAGLAKQILNYIKANEGEIGLSKRDIVVEFFGEGSTEEIDQALNFMLHSSKKLRMVGDKYKLNI